MFTPFKEVVMLSPVVAEINRAGRAVQGATYVSYRRRHPAAPAGHAAPRGTQSDSFTATAVALTPPRRRRTKR